MRHLAVAGYDRVRAIDSDYVQTLVDCGDMLSKAGRFEEAILCYDRGLRLQPDNAGALYNRALILRRLGRSDEALVDIDRVLVLNPSFADALISRAIIKRLRGDIGEALASLREAMKLRPNDSKLHTTYLFTLNFYPSVTEAEKQRERKEWEKRHAQEFISNWRPHDNEPVLGRRLRVGYVSSYFGYDNSTYSFGHVILNRDGDKFEIFCYSDTVNEDDATAILRERAHHWRRTHDLSDDQMAELIRSDRIDILVDCLGHMPGNRLLVFARKPSPIQVTAWGEVTGTGLRAMDYLLGTRVLVPESDRCLFVERVIDLPNFSGFWSPDQLPDVVPLPALKNGYITFGSFSRLPKINEQTIRCWAAILQRLPGARLVLKHSRLVDSAQRMRLSTAFQKQGVSPGALTLLGGTDRQTHFACYNMIDIALDPFPHAGGMTTLDALWMGVPVVALPGESVSTRWAATSLVPLGLSDFLADSEESYVELAVTKAGDLEALSRLRMSLRARVANSEFGDGPRFCHAVEAAYREIWERWCRERGFFKSTGVEE